MAEGGDVKASATAPVIFISYASQDAAVAGTACEALEKAGVTCWIAPRDVTPGAFYGDEIVHAIDAAKATVLILSQSAATSPHVLREVERAASKRHAVISLRIDKAPLPPGFEYFLNTSQWLDASCGETARALSKLVSAVQVAIQASAVPPTGVPTAYSPARPVSARSRKRLVFVVASVVSLALLGFAADRLWLSGHRAAATPATTPVAPAPPAVPASPTIPEKSVAVLPFVDMSAKKDQEYFADGLSEELIDMLARVPDLRVPARTSSFYFKEKQVTLTEIAKALRVANVLEGSVRESGNRLRITAQLVRADNGYHLWSETYDRQLDDIFKIQDEIATAVVKALKISLLNSAALRVAPPTTSSEAYTLYVQARALLLHGTPADAARAADCLERAIQLDPKYAPAWARLTQARTFQYEMGLLSFAQAREEARRSAQQALELDPNLAAAHLSMARVHRFFDWNWDAAGAQIQRARQLDPGDADALRWAGIQAEGMGHVTEAIDLFQQAVDLDPLDGANYALLGEANLAIDRYAPADFAFRRAVELAPARGFGADVGHGQVLLATDQAAAALTLFEQLEDAGDREWGKAMAYFALGRKAESDTAVANLESNFAETRTYQIARVHAYRREIDQAFKWLDRAYQKRDPDLAMIKADSFMRTLRNDHRYGALLRKVNLPE